MTTLLIVSDTHINSTVAICPSEVELDDGGSYRPSRGQRWLWAGGKKLTEHMQQYKGYTLIVNGDAVMVERAVDDMRLSRVYRKP